MLFERLLLICGIGYTLLGCLEGQTRVVPGFVVRPTHLTKRLLLWLLGHGF